MNCSDEHTPEHVCRAPLHTSLTHTHTHHVHILCFIEIRLCMPHDMKQNKADLFFKVCRILFVYFHPNISLICQTCFL